MRRRRRARCLPGAPTNPSTPLRRRTGRGTGTATTASIAAIRSLRARASPQRPVPLPAGGRRPVNRTIAARRSSRNPVPPPRRVASPAAAVGRWSKAASKEARGAVGSTSAPRAGRFCPIVQFCGGATRQSEGHSLSLDKEDPMKAESLSAVVFFSPEPEPLAEFYRRQLGIDFKPRGPRVDRRALRDLVQRNSSRRARGRRRGRLAHLSRSGSRRVRRRAGRGRPRPASMPSRRC